MLIISLEREYARGPVERTVVERLDELRPHIARSAFLSARLQLERARIASETLATLGLPGLVDRFLESAHMRGIPSKQHGVYILVQ
jgi:hypothetical protein